MSQESAQSSSRSSPVQDLLCAVDNGDVDIVKHILKEATNIVNATNKVLFNIVVTCLLYVA